MRLRWTQRAQRDLGEIQRFIAEDDPDAARRWVQKLRERARAALAFPLAGRVVPELGRAEIREVFLRTYRIVYRLQEGTLDVLTVFEGHRLLEVDPEGSGGPGCQDI